MREFTTVKKNSKGTDVVVVQVLLRALQFVGKDNKPIDVTGTCDENTIFAINSFQAQQRAYGYECGTNGKNDSTFGKKCWERILG